MSKRKIYAFLRDLTDNNSKQWMDANRDRYEEAKGIWTEECQSILDQLVKQDDYYREMEARETVERINNNLMYHPEKPTYKNHFGFSPGEIKGTGLYVSVSPSYSFIGGGVHNPSNEQLKPIRAAIDERGDELRQIIDSKNIQEYFGGLEDDPKKLKTSPQGYEQNHKHIELLRRKNFTLSKRITQDEVLDDDFPQLVADSYQKMRGLLNFMRQAMADLTN